MEKINNVDEDLLEQLYQVAREDISSLNIDEFFSLCKEENDKEMNSFLKKFCNIDIDNTANILIERYVKERIHNYTLATDGIIIKK
tara:strand:+ start:1365 stop:1622 length:258 start_codon:yes stop_codon:yes gene_type:complete